MWYISYSQYLSIYTKYKETELYKIQAFESYCVIFKTPPPLPHFIYHITTFYYSLIVYVFTILLPEVTLDHNTCLPIKL